MSIKFQKFSFVRISRFDKMHRNRRRQKPATVNTPENDIHSQISKHPLIEPSLNLSKKNIEFIPKQLFQLSYIENLYLSDNSLEVLPDKFFEKLPRLCYLDLRNNNLSEIPTFGLADHKCLKVALFSRNNITKLPSELGFVESLYAMHHIGNPIIWPEKEHLELSTPELKKYLKKCVSNKLDRRS